jgi:hypothetical protein
MTRGRYCFLRDNLHMGGEALLAREILKLLELGIDLCSNTILDARVEKVALKE